MPLLFVYGTLLRGEHNHAQLDGARFVEDTRTTAAFTLVDLGEHPALLARGEQAVIGELYEVDEAEIPRLDRFEDHPDFFVRSLIRLDDGREVFSYLLPEDRARGGRRIESGDWKARE